MKKKIENNKRIIPLDEIDELNFLIFIVKPENEQHIVDRINELGGRTVLTDVAEGISRDKKIELLGIQPIENIVVFATARKEDARNLLVAIDTEFNFNVPGNGLGLIVDVDGYMGAKGLFVE